MCVWSIITVCRFHYSSNAIKPQGGVQCIRWYCKKNCNNGTFSHIPSSYLQAQVDAPICFFTTHLQVWYFYCRCSARKQIQWYHRLHCFTTLKCMYYNVVSHRPLSLWDAEHHWGLPNRTPAPRYSARQWHVRCCRERTAGTGNFFLGRAVGSPERPCCLHFPMQCWSAWSILCLDTKDWCFRCHIMTDGEVFV